ncbi:NADH-quinone oxidoreductase subunit C [Paenibacillus lupini]|uniref:NADH-quinone oxidoreductase subunit C n=1 Tax=Paenibacillus lupini TaxID=1450204 RepID=UPI0014240150|nr:NADH-quinone oxidoreductase subunit C [Paenibacillus lupini]NIK25672.1 NADH-quinone oxidoreductase subunit C [Paenibacillus lupini]
MSEEKDEEKQGEEAKEASSSKETPVESPTSEGDTVVSAGSTTLDSERSIVSTPEAAADPEREAKLKAAAEARAARAAAKEAANVEGAPEAAADPEREAKLKAAAEARAARAAAKEAANAGGAAAGDAAVDPEKEAKLKAAAEARAARAAAKEAANAGGAPAGEAAEPPPPPPPSPKQPQLDAAAQLIRSLVHEEALEDAYINEMNGHMPTFIVKNEHWYATAVQLKQHEELHFSYLRNVSGVDYETHLEVVYHLVDLESRRELAVKIKADRSTPVVASATPVWATANWNEREIYDLLGVTFPGHPDLRRIMMSDDWVGHPLRKDYEPLDSEV